MDSKNNAKFISRRKFLSATATALGGLTLAACGQSPNSNASPAASSAASTPASGSAAAPTGGQAGGALNGAAIKWSSWGNPGEIERFNQYTADFNTRTGAKAELLPMPSDYESNMNSLSA